MKCKLFRKSATQNQTWVFSCAGSEMCPSFIKEKKISKHQKFEVPTHCQTDSSLLCALVSAWKLRKTSACVVQFANDANTSVTVSDLVFRSASVFDSWVLETSIWTLCITAALMLFAYVTCSSLLQRWTFTFPECIADV